MDTLQLADGRPFEREALWQRGRCAVPVHRHAVCLVLSALLCVLRTWPAGAQGPPPGHAPSTSVFATLNIVPPPATESDWRFEAAHLDFAVASEHLRGLRRLRPGMPLLKYRLVETTVVGTEEAAVSALCSSRGLDPEDAYLHYADDAEVRTPKGIIRIPGWGSGHASDRAAARIKFFMWADWRWTFNLRSRCALEYLSARSVDDVTPKAEAPAHDGLFVDELPAPDDLEAVVALPPTLRPARIAEFGARTREDAIRGGDYQRALCGALEAIGREMKRVAPGRGWVMANAAQWISPGVFAIGTCADGIVTEAMAREEATQGDEGEVNVWRFAARLDSAGRMYVLVPQGLNPAASLGLDRGNYPSPVERHRMYGLTSYWMARRGPRTFYGQGVEWRAMSAYWMKAQEVDLGAPRGDPYVWHEDMAAGDSIGQHYRVYRRDFERAIVVFRTRIGWSARDFRSYASPTPAFPLGGCYQVLRPDANLGPPVTSVGLRLSEGVALIPCSSGGR